MISNTNFLHCYIDINYFAMAGVYYMKKLKLSLGRISIEYTQLVQRLGILIHRLKLLHRISNYVNESKD